MWNSVKNIGREREELSIFRNDKVVFRQEDFFKFAKENKRKYNLDEQGDDFMVNTWNINALINDFKKING